MFLKIFKIVESVFISCQFDIQIINLFSGLAYSETKQVLHTATPEHLPCREREIAEIQNFLEDHLNRQTAGSMYISGAPGTGKTASLLHIIDNLKVLYFRILLIYIQSLYASVLNEMNYNFFIITYLQPY